MKFGCVLNRSVSSILTQYAYEILIHFPPGSTDDQYDKMLLFLPKTWSNRVAALCIKPQLNLTLLFLLNSHLFISFDPKKENVFHIA